MADWLAIKTEYIAGGISQRELAKKYGVSPSTLRDRAKRENWGEETRSITLKTAQKAAQKISDAQSDIVAIKEQMKLLWWERQLNALKSLMSEEETLRNSADARRELQNYIDLLTVDSGTPDEDMGEQINAARQSFRDFIGEINGTE